MDKKLASRLLEKVLNKSVDIAKVDFLGSGYHSNGYKLTTNEGVFFLKELKSEDRGFEFPERKISSLLVSHGMNVRANVWPKSFGVVTVDKNELNTFTKVGEECQVFEVQEFGGIGETLLEAFDKRKSKKDIGDEDLYEINETIKFISSVHKKRYNDNGNADNVYNDYLRSVIGHPEYTTQLLHTFDVDDEILPFKDQSKILSIMLKFMHKWKNRGDRLAALHGDFWVSNCINSAGKYYFIDFSRMPWGDPGFDIGIWTTLFVVKYITTGNEYFKKYVEIFLEKYIEKTKDSDIIKTMIYPYAPVLIMYASESWVPGYTTDERKKIRDYFFKLLEKEEFTFF